MIRRLGFRGHFDENPPAVGRVAHPAGVPGPFQAVEGGGGRAGAETRRSGQVPGAQAVPRPKQPQAAQIGAVNAQAHTGRFVHQVGGLLELRDF